MTRNTAAPEGLLTLEQAGWTLIGQCPEGCHTGYMSPQDEVCEVPTRYVGRIYIKVEIKEMGPGFRRLN